MLDNGVAYLISPGGQAISRQISLQQALFDEAVEKRAYALEIFKPCAAPEIDTFAGAKLEYASLLGVALGRHAPGERLRRIPVRPAIAGDAIV